jgi:hypothetical protein
LLSGLEYALTLYSFRESLNISLPHLVIAQSFETSE